MGRGRAQNPAIAKLDEATRFPPCHADRLTDLFKGGALDGVELVGLEIETVFSGFDDYWNPMLGGQGPAPSYVASLSRDDRDTLRASLRRTLLDRGDPISLTARAWAVRGIV